MIRYYWSNQYKYIWYLTPKTGKAEILSQINNRYDGLYQSPKNKSNNTQLPIKYRHYFKFAFCRNPFDRLVAIYLDKAKKEKLSFYYSWDQKDFKTFALDVCNMDLKCVDPYIIPQSYLIPDEVDFIGKFESLSSDLQKITRQLFHSNIARIYNSTNDYMSYYDNELIEKVYDFYHVDFKRFGYPV